MQARQVKVPNQIYLCGRKEELRYGRQEKNHIQFVFNKNRFFWISNIHLYRARVNIAKKNTVTLPRRQSDLPV